MYYEATMVNISAGEKDKFKQSYGNVDVSTTTIKKKRMEKRKEEERKAKRGEKEWIELAAVVWNQRL